MRAVGYPEKYPQVAARPCEACSESGRGDVIMRPHFTRDCTEEHGNLVLACPRCMHQVIISTSIPLDVLSRPSGRLFVA